MRFANTCLESLPSPASEPPVVERVVFDRPPGLGGATVQSVDGARRHWTMVHTNYVVALATGGRGRWRCRGQTRDLGPGTLQLIEPGDVHSTLRVDDPGASFRAFFIPPNLAERATLTAGREIRFGDIQNQDADLVAIWSRLADTVDNPASEPLERSQKFHHAWHSLVRRVMPADRRAPATPHDAAARTAELIRAAFEASANVKCVTIDDLADEVGLSATSLIKEFRRCFGLPPYQYVIRLRLARFQQLIERGPGDGLRTLADAAIEAGFYDLPQAGKFLAKLTGVTPREYATQIGSLALWRRPRGQP